MPPRSPLRPPSQSAELDPEIAIETPQSRLARLMPEAPAEHRSLAISAAHALYGQNLSRVPSDLLRSLVDRAPIYIRHGLTTEAKLQEFLKQSWAQTLTPILGGSGYTLALSLMGLLAGSHIPSPATGLPIGAAVMFTTVNTGALRDGIEARRFPALETSGLPSTLQQRYDHYAKEMLPAGVRAEVTRQIVRSMVTLVPVLHAMRNGHSVNQAKIVANDVIADAVTFAAAGIIDGGTQKAWQGLKSACLKICSGANALSARCIQAPTYQELLAHQPEHVLERRLEAHEQSSLQSVSDGLKGAAEGLTNLWTNKFGRLLGVPLNAAMVIFMALGMTEFLIGKDQKNADMPDGQISPRSALAVPGTLIYMEMLVTLAFTTLLQACDAIASRTAPLELRDEDVPPEIYNAGHSLLPSSIEPEVTEPTPAGHIAQQIV